MGVIHQPCPDTVFLFLALSPLNVNPLSCMSSFLLFSHCFIQSPMINYCCTENVLLKKNKKHLRPEAENNFLSRMNQFTQVTKPYNCTRKKQLVENLKNLVQSNYTQGWNFSHHVHVSKEMFFLWNIWRLLRWKKRKPHLADRLYSFELKRFSVLFHKCIFVQSFTKVITLRRRALHS